jgi:phage tail-like protein
MDVNGTRFHAINSSADWARLMDDAETHDVYWHADRAELTLLPRLFEFPAPAGVDSPPSETIAPLGVTQRRGAGADCYGDVFWIGADERSINLQFNHRGDVGQYWHLDHLDERCTTAADSLFQPVEKAEAETSTRLRGLAVTEDHYLVVGTLAPAGLLIFDLHAGGPASTWLRWPSAVDFRPFDIAPARGGGVWVLDRYREAPATRPPVYWRLDRWFRVVGCITDGSPSEIPQISLFGPVSGNANACRVERLPEPFAIDLDAASPPLVTHAVAILQLTDGSVLILETDPASDTSVAHRFVNGVASGIARLESTIHNDSGEFVRVAGHDFVFRGGELSPTGEVSGYLYVADRAGNQTYVYTLSTADNQLELELLPVYLPMRRYSGKALILRNDQVHYDLSERWLPLVEKQRPRYEPQGVVAGLLFDGKQTGCIWHRLFLDACIPQDSSVRVQSRAADDVDALDGEDWFTEPTAYLRENGSELPWYDAYSEQERKREPRAGTWELLFQHARGRYLELRLELTSTGKRSPALRALRIYYPRFSYLRRYLPAVYEDDESSAGFIERFLANGEGLLSDLEGQIERAEFLLDVRTAPAEYIEWLAGWMGVAFDADWEDRRRRLFLEHAELIYRWRGTEIGLRAAIRVATEACPDQAIFSELEAGEVDPLAAHGVNAVRIVETFLTRALPGVAVGDPTQTVGPQAVDPEAAWDPSLGSEPLHGAFRAFLLETYGSENTVLDVVETRWLQPRPASIDALLFKPVVPDNEHEAADWLRFTRDGLGFTYADVRNSDTQLYREYLAASYAGIQDLNQAYALTGDQGYRDFSVIGLPDALPASGTPLFDWIGFVSQTVPIERQAHRFSVLVPTTPAEALDLQTQRLSRVQQIVEREKPANTDFDVKLYWALFRIGAARVGLDTTLGESSRFVAIVLGREYLGQSYLERSHPWNVADRSVLGRDRLRES